MEVMEPDLWTGIWYTSLPELESLSDWIQSWLRTYVIICIMSNTKKQQKLLYVHIVSS
jgi:hypothetical protein